MDKIIIYTDGGCHNNQDRENSIGGWAAIIQYKDKEKEIWGGELQTTNNRMELMGSIKALQELKKFDIPVEIHSDSNYLVKGMNEWIHSWVKKGWKNSQKKTVENKDLWIMLLDLKNKFKNITFHHVKGHNGHELNERADELTQKAISELEI